MDIKHIDCADQAPIFIGGPKRSGSTLLRRIINSHSQITVPSPEWIFHFVYMHLYSYGDLNNDANMNALIQDCLDIPLINQYWPIKENAEQILSILPERSFRGVFVTLFMIYMKDNPTPHWGVKTPSNVFWTREIHQMFPKSKFIFLYRDGRDVSIDQVDAPWGPLNLHNACILWNHYIDAMIQSKPNLPRESVYELKYENMVRNPEKEIEQLCGFLGVEYESSMLGSTKSGDDLFFKQSHHVNAAKPITDQFVGMYKKLPLEDRQLQTAIMGSNLRKLGYVVEETPREIGFWESKWCVEEDEYGGTLIDGGPQYKYGKRIERLKRKKQGIWTDADRLKHFRG